MMSSRVAHGLAGVAGLGVPNWNAFGTELGGGFGLKFGETFTVRPSIIVPTDRASGTREPTFSMSASFAIGRKR